MFCMQVHQFCCCTSMMFFNGSICSASKILNILWSFKKEGYNLDNFRQTACLEFDPIFVESYAALFSCMAVVQASD